MFAFAQLVRIGRSKFTADATDSLAKQRMGNFKPVTRQGVRADDHQTTRCCSTGNSLRDATGEVQLLQRHEGKDIDNAEQRSPSDELRARTRDSRPAADSGRQRVMSSTTGNNDGDAARGASSFRLMLHVEQIPLRAGAAFTRYQRRHPWREQCDTKYLALVLIRRRLRTYNLGSRTTLK